MQFTETMSGLAPILEQQNLRYFITKYQKKDTHAHSKAANYLIFSETEKYSKTCVKRPLINIQNKDLNDKW